MKKILLVFSFLLVLFMPSVLSIDLNQHVGNGSLTDCLNLINNSYIGCTIDESNQIYTINNSPSYYISGIVLDANNITLDCNHAKIIDSNPGGDWGIDVEGAHDITIINCNIIEFGRGIYIYNSANITIKNNAFNNTAHETILLYAVHNVNLSSNTFKNNSYVDIYITGASSNINFLTPVQGTSIYAEGSSSFTLPSYALGSPGLSQIKYPNFEVIDTNSFDTKNDFAYGPGFVSINSASSPALNSKANVTINGIDCANFNLWYASGFYTSLADIIANGDLVATRTNIGGDCTDNSVCKNVQCSGGALTFEAQHFDGFGGGEGVTSTGAGNVSINLTEEVSIMVKFNIDFGSGRVDAGSNYAILDSDAENATNSTWVFKPQYLYIENDGTVNESINITTDKNASAFLGGTNPGYQVMGIDTEWGACAGTLLDYYFNISTEPQTICDLLQFGIDYDSINASVMLIVPSDAPSGKKESVLTFTAKMV